MPLDIHTEVTPSGVPVARIRGEIDLFGCPQLRSALYAIVDTGQRDMVLDLAEVPYVDSAGMGALVDVVRRAPGTVHLVGVIPFVLRALAITGLQPLFTLQDTLDAALEAIASQDNSQAGSLPQRLP